MNIEKVNGFWVPSNDVHIEQWKSGLPFNQNKCLNKFIKYCESQTKKMKTVIDVGAWGGTWAKAIEPFAKKVIAFEPDQTHFECLQRNCTVNCTVNCATNCTVNCKLCCHFCCELCYDFCCELYCELCCRKCRAAHQA